VKTYTTQGGEYTYFESICALYELHFGLSKEEAERLAILLGKMGFWSVKFNEFDPEGYSHCYFKI
jgi:hypothetical protein